RHHWFVARDVGEDFDVGERRREVEVAEAGASAGLGRGEAGAYGRAFAAVRALEHSDRRTRVFGQQPFEDGARVVGAAVVDEDQLAPGRLLADERQQLVEVHREAA